MAEPVRTRIDGAVLEVTLDRPKANAIDSPTSQRLGAVFAEFAADPALRVAILTAAGERFFSAGWDLKAAAAGSEVGDYGVGGFGGLTEAFDLDKPVIAAVNGLCVGGGFEIALACDLMVAADHATFMLTEVSVGLTPEPVGVRRLLDRLPRALALEVLYARRRLTAAEAGALGLANRVVPGSHVLEAAREIAAAIVAAAPLAVAACAEIVRETATLSLTETADLQRAGGLPLYERAKTSADAREGPLAFAEKRKPVWTGR